MSRESVRGSLRRIKDFFGAAEPSRRPSGRRRRAILKVESLEERLVLSTVVLGQQPGAPNNTVFHGDAAGTGFDENETVLTPANVASSFGQVWQSPVLDGAVYATPLSMDSLLIKDAVSGVNGNAAKNAGDGIQNATFMGKTLGVVFAATGGGSVYCIAAARHRWADRHRSRNDPLENAFGQSVCRSRRQQHRRVEHARHRFGERPPVRHRVGDGLPLAQRHSESRRQ